MSTLAATAEASSDTPNDRASDPATDPVGTDPAEWERMQATIAEKDDLVALLTDRLEQAVERLDRLKRSGAKPQPAEAPSAGLGGEIERLVQEWDTAQLPTATDRIEQQLTALQDAIRDGFDNLHQLPAASDPTDDAPSGSGWEAMKAALMSGESQPADAPANAVPATKQPVAEPGDDVELDVPDELEVATPEIVAAIEPPPLEELPPAPAAIDVDTCDAATLAEAVRVRDAYIIGLTQRALDRRVKLEAPTDWEQIRGVPGELIKSVRRLHDELDDAVRMAEVQLCLERAKLSRERTELDTLRAELAKPAAEPTPEETVKERRWRRMLGSSGS